MDFVLIFQMLVQVSWQINNNTKPIETTENINVPDTVNPIFTQDDMIQMYELKKAFKCPSEFPGVDRIPKRALQ